MPRDPSTVADRLIDRLRSIERTRQRVEKLLRNRNVTQRDVETIYAGLFTNAVTSMEGFLEDLFTGLVSQSLRCRRARPLTTFRQGAVATRFILGSKPYVEWLPYSHTKDRATIFFRKGRPFSELPDNLVGDLKKASLIRNVLVHSSAFAREQFESKVIGSTPLAPRERRPVGFLRSNFRIAPDQQRFELYLTAFADAARFLAQES